MYSTQGQQHFKQNYFKSGHLLFFTIFSPSLLSSSNELFCKGPVMNQKLKHVSLKTTGQEGRVNKVHMVMILSDWVLKLSTKFWFCYRGLMNRNFPKALHWSPREVSTRWFFNPEDNICELLQPWLYYVLFDSSFIVVPS